MLLIEQKFELDLHLGSAGVDQLIVGARPRLAPQRPGDRVQQRGLAVAVIAGQAGHMDAGKVQRLVDIRVAHEVAHREAQRDHGSSR